MAYVRSSQRIPHHSRIGGKCRLAEVLLERLKDLDDAIYIESPESVAELELCGQAFRALNMTSMLEGGKTPILKPSDLHAMGFNIVIYGITLLVRIARTMQLALEDLKSERLELVGSGVSFDEYMRIVALDRWSAIERRFDVERAEA